MQEDRTVRTGNELGSSNRRLHVYLTRLSRQCAEGSDDRVMPLIYHHQVATSVSEYAGGVQHRLGQPGKGHHLPDRGKTGRCGRSRCGKTALMG